MAPPVSRSKPTDAYGKRLYEMLEGYAADGQISSEEAANAVKGSKPSGKINPKAKNGVDLFFQDYCLTGLKLDPGVRDKFVTGLGISEETFEKCTKDWPDLGLNASPDDFAMTNYAFGHVRELSADPAPPSFLSPVDQITVAGNEGVVIPWSDPYLMLEYQAFLKSAGVEIRGTWGGVLFNTDYYYKGHRLMDSREKDGIITFKLYNPIGDVVRELNFSRPQKPEVKVTFPSDPETQPHRITVYGHETEIWAYFPQKYSETEREQILKNVGNAFQILPKAMVIPILTGVDAEKKLTIYIADEDKAEELGIISSNSQAAGIYSIGVNRVWLTLTKDYKSLADRLLHEIGGHAFADFAVPTANYDALEQSGRSGLSDYYLWKIAQLFTPKEVAQYDELLRDDRRWESAAVADRKGEEGIRISLALSPFRNKAAKRFLSRYAVEGTLGLRSQMDRPLEYFAEAMQEFYKLFREGDLKSKRERDPILTLAGLAYLMYEYEIPSIGGIRREEVFSEKAFREVLGIDLKGVNREAYLGREPVPDSRSAVSDSHQSGDIRFMGTLTGCAQPGGEALIGLSDRSVGFGANFLVGLQGSSVPDTQGPQLFLGGELSLRTPLAPVRFELFGRGGVASNSSPSGESANGFAEVGGRIAIYPSPRSSTGFHILLGGGYLLDFSDLDRSTPRFALGLGFSPQ